MNWFWLCWVFTAAHWLFSGCGEQGLLSGPSGCGEQGLLSGPGGGLLVAVAPLVEYRL